LGVLTGRYRLHHLVKSDSQISVAIRNYKNGAFYTRASWTSEPAEAQFFDSVPEAIQVCTQEQIPDAEIVLLFPGEPRSQLTVRAGLRVL
jgi:hypothetical protein